MAACPACGAPTDPVDRFCGRCGKGLVGVAPVDSGIARFCGGCGSALEADARFCRSCGAEVPEPQVDVFADLPAPKNGHGDLPGPGNGHEVLADTEPVDVLGPAPADRPPVHEAPTESIPRATPSHPPAMRKRPPSPPTPPDPEPGPPSAPRATATIERRPRVRPAERMTETLRAHPPLEEAPAPAAVRRYTGFPWGGTLALLGALAVIISAVLDWGGPFSESLPRDISATWLLDPGTVTSGPSLGAVVLIAGTLGALVSLVGMAAPAFTFLRRLVGLLTVMIPVAFGLRTLEALVDEASILDLPSALGVGVAIAAAGAFVELSAGKGARR